MRSKFVEDQYGPYELLRTFIRVEFAHIWQATGSAPTQELVK
jgi:hypothetical protein